ncbi:MAG: sporulation protein YunB [Clostridioides sp.]|nr:sporulation protein YunB [Clostridioides sp.]
MRRKFNKNKYKKNFRSSEADEKNVKKAVLILVVIFIWSVVIGSFIYIDRTLRPTITVLAETKALELANKSINQAVAELVEGQVNYEDLMDVRLDNSGKITMIQANTIMMNELASSVALGIQEELQKGKTTSAFIPIGTALGSPILAQHGPKIKLSTEPIGTTTVNFKTKFESSGINQTRHRIYLEAKTQVKVIIPLITSTKEVKSQIPICETIIVGDVPNSYVNIPESDLGSAISDIQTFMRDEQNKKTK